MEILNLGGAAEENSAAPKSRKKFRVILGIGALAAVTGIGSTLAANISLNGGGNVEFGQGVATTAACDNDITLTPISTFSNTEEDATFAMTAIQVSGIDLTPEGWDATLNSGDGGWAEGFVWESHTWNDGYQERSGQYKNAAGTWTNTCENKVLMLRAYTDTPDNDVRTSDLNISSPLLLSGGNNQRPSYFGYGSNTGVGFRVHHSYGVNPSWGNIDLMLDCDYDCEDSPMDLDYDLNGDSWMEDSSVTIYLDNNDYYLPADSRWIDKITAESAASVPNNWDYWSNWFGG